MENEKKIRKDIQTEMNRILEDLKYLKDHMLAYMHFYLEDVPDRIFVEMNRTIDSVQTTQANLEIAKNIFERHVLSGLEGKKDEN